MADLQRVRRPVGTVTDSGMTVVAPGVVSNTASAGRWRGVLCTEGRAGLTAAHRTIICLLLGCAEGERPTRNALPGTGPGKFFPGAAMNVALDDLIRRGWLRWSAWEPSRLTLIRRGWLRWSAWEPSRLTAQAALRIGLDPSAYPDLFPDAPAP